MGVDCTEPVSKCKIDEIVVSCLQLVDTVTVQEQCSAITWHVAGMFADAPMLRNRVLFGIFYLFFVFFLMIFFRA